MFIVTTYYRNLGHSNYESLVSARKVLDGRDDSNYYGESVGVTQSRTQDTSNCC